MDHTDDSIRDSSFRLFLALHCAWLFGFESSTHSTQFDPGYWKMMVVLMEKIPTIHFGCLMFLAADNRPASKAPELIAPGALLSIE